MNTILSLKNINFFYKSNFSYKNTSVIKNFSLDVEEGSFTTLLGSSGCGKTTLLRLISGFLNPTSGTIEIDGKNQNGIEPNKRSVGMVFQDYALFPHLTVKQNIEYGLKIQKVKEIDKIVLDSAEKLNITELLNRYPNELSGGQQQRGALARAIVLKPKILLMDEPLSSLDSKLREKVRSELREIQQNLKITTIYVTHDQDEALSLSDKIAVLDEGILQQYGTPQEIYFEPKNRFVADFVGRANFIEENGKTFMIRPEWFELNPVISTEACIELVECVEKSVISGKIISSEFLGNKTRFSIEIQNNQCLIVDLDTIEVCNLSVNEEIILKINKKVSITENCN